METFAITAYVPPNATFRIADFSAGSSACCVGLKIGGQGVDANRIEQFETKAKAVKVEMAFFLAANVQEVTLVYRNAPTDPNLKVAR